MTVAAYCGARKRQGEGNCKRPSGWGTDHPGAGYCKLHGGSTRDQSVGAMAEQARRQIARLDLPPTDDPLGELAKVTAQVVAWKDAMAEQVNSLTSLRYESLVTGGGSGEQLRSEVALFERALDRCEKFLTAMAKLNIDERLARVTEKQAAMAEKALLATLGDLGMDASQQAVACEHLGRHLSLVS